ncbi:MAG: hypothetical protein K9G48_09000 [Reyranella sp.]|nr:hypothetical protein [Reyranella sp.]
MIALLGALLGLFGSMAPRLIGYFEQKAGHSQELEMIRVQGEFQLQMIQSGHAAKMAEVGQAADVSREIAAFRAAARPTGIKWVDAFNGMVRPTLTLSFFALYAAIKAGQYFILVGDAGFASAITSLWTEEDAGIWSAIIVFWFGNRSLNRGR